MVSRRAEVLRDLAREAGIPGPSGSGNGSRAGDDKHKGKESKQEPQSQAKPPSQATKLVAIAMETIDELWHSPDYESYATFDVDGHKEHWPLSSKALRQCLSHMYYKRHRNTPSSQAVQDSINALAGKALHEGKEYPVYTRICEIDGVVYLDMGDTAWRAIAIGKEGWKVIHNAGVKFRRSRGMLALPEPVRGGKLSGLWRFVNVATKEDRALVPGWLVGSVRERGPFPVLALYGEQGTGKSTAARLLRSLIDPNMALLRSVPKDERDLMIAAKNSWVITLDNLSGLPRWLSDALCRLSTGGGLATRELYTDSEEAIFDAQRPVIINGIEDVVERGDLLDRLVAIYLQVIDPDNRLTEKAFWAAFETEHPALLGALLDAVVESLRNEDSVSLPQKPRMADFAVRAVAAERTFNVPIGTFMEAYTDNREASHELAIEASAIGPYVKSLAEQGFKGTATELLRHLDGLVDESKQRSKDWPKRANRLSGMLTRLAPHLRAIGITVEIGKSGDRFIEFIKNGGNTVPTVQTAQTGTKPADGPSSNNRPVSPEYRPTSEGVHAYADDTDDTDDDSPSSSESLPFHNTDDMEEV